MNKRAMELPLNTIIIVVLVVIVLVSVGFIFFTQFGAGTSQLKQSQSGVSTGISKLGEAAQNFFSGSTSGGASTPSCKGTGTLPCGVYNMQSDLCNAVPNCHLSTVGSNINKCMGSGTIPCTDIKTQDLCKTPCSWS